MNLIYFSDTWDDMWRRRQQIAWRLAKKEGIHRTWYLEQPLTLTSRIKDWWGQADLEAHNRWQRVRQKGLAFTVNGVTVVTPVTPLPPMSNLIGDRLNHWAYERTVRRIARANRGAQLLLWLSKPTDLPWVDYFDPVLICYDSTDKFWEYEGTPAWLREQSRYQDEELARRADVVFVQTEQHLQEKQALGANVFLIPNAVDTDRFDLSVNVPPDLADIPSPRIGYVGSINNRLDWDLIEYVLTRLHQYSIIFIGNTTDPHCEQLAGRYKNAYFLGYKPYAQVPAYLCGMDVCIIPFPDTIVTASQSPLKLFDYLAAGKPIVSTRGGQLGELAQWVYVADNYDGFCEGIKRAIDQDCCELQEARRAVAEQNSWNARVNQVWEIVSERLAEKMHTAKGR